MVAGYLAKEYAEKNGRSGDLAIISGDNAPPYERPPLSKSFLAGKDTESSVLISQPDFYSQHGIELRLNTNIVSIDTQRKRLQTESGEELGFEKLVLATGAQVRKLDLADASTGNVLYLRSLSDSKRIRENATSGKKAVVIGGGFIAMEVSSVLASRGVETTMLIRDDRMWKTFFTPEMSAFFLKYYVDRGVRVMTQTSVGAMESEAAVR